MKFLPASFLLISLFVLPGLSESQEQKLIPPPEITFPGEYPLSSVSGVLRSIAQARGDIHDNKLQSAGDALNDARLRIGFIIESSPVAHIRDYIWAARRHLSLGDTEKAMQDLIAAKLALSSFEETRFVEHARKFINKAMSSLENKDKESARLELELTEKSLEYSGVDLPLSNAESYIVSAQGFLTRNRPEEAGKALRYAEDQLQFVVVDLYTPLPKAREDISASRKNFANQEFGAAKKELDKAGDYLRKAAARGDAVTKAEAGRLLEDMESAKVKVEKRAKGTGEYLESLWERARALAERDTEYATLIVRKAEKVNTLEKNIIDAKMYVSYAESYHLTSGDSRKAKAEIDTAEGYIKDAMPQADETTRAQLSAINRELNSLKSESNERNEAIRDQYRHVEEELSRLIREGKRD